VKSLEHEGKRTEVILGNVAWGLRGIAPLIVVYCAWVLLLHSVFGAAPFERVGASVWAVIALYVGTGCFAGVSVGLLRPKLTARLWCHVTGLLVGVAVGIGVALTRHGLPSRWGADAWLGLLLFGTGGAVGVGNELWKRFGLGKL
jgi:hypothetical protein